MKKYRVAKVVDWRTPRIQVTAKYYPQVRKFGIWFYIKEPQGRPGDMIYCLSEESAWDWIEKQKQCGVEYIYEREG